MKGNTKQNSIARKNEEQKAIIIELAKVSEHTLGGGRPCAESYGFFKPKGM